jgi:hypothetical protein
MNAMLLCMLSEHNKGISFRCFTQFNWGSLNAAKSHALLQSFAMKILPGQKISLLELQLKPQVFVNEK